MSEPVPTPNVGAQPPVPPAVPPLPPPMPPGAQGTRTLAIVGIALAWFLAPAGLVVSLIALRQTRPGQPERRLAIIGLVASIVLTVVMVVFFIVAGEFLQGLREVMEGETAG